MLKQHSSGIANRNLNRPAKLAAGLAAAALLCLGQGGPRQGPFGAPEWSQKGQQWILTRTIQEFTIPDQIHRVQLLVHGNLTIHGGPTNQAQGNLKQTVRANSQQEALGAVGPTFGRVFVERDVLTLDLQSRYGRTDIEINLPRRVMVDIRNQAGNIEVNDIAASVTASTGGGGIQMDRIDGSVVGQTASGDIQLGDISGTVNCIINQGGAFTLHYAKGAVSCRSGSGDVFVKFAGGSLDVVTEGNIHVEQVGGDVRAHSMGGSIEVGQAGGTVTADTLGGSIEVGSSKGVRAESGAGRVKVRGGSGPMSVSTMMGDVLAELVRGGRLENSTVSTAAGDITLMIPAGMGLSIHATNSSGAGPRIMSDFPEIHVKSIWERAPATVQGTINGGGPTIDLTAAGGAIYLRKVK